MFYQPNRTITFAVPVFVDYTGGKNPLLVTDTTPRYPGFFMTCLVRADPRPKIVKILVPEA
jgi:hypothetical protein